jgi:putative sigma-54 modulation protein
VLKSNIIKIKEYIMNTSIVGRHITLTDSIKDHINSSIQNFKKYNLDIISVNSIISQESKNSKNLISFEFTLNVANIDTIVIKQRDKDLYNAIDIAVDRTLKVLRRHHEKIVEHKATKLTKVQSDSIEDNVARELEKFDSEIIPMKLNSYKPTNIEDALLDLKNSESQFKVFYDNDDNMRVLYKTNQDSKFGLY